MPLTNYEEVAAYGRMIVYVTQKKWMPPFLATVPEAHFKGEKKLTDQEISLIKQWVDQGMSEGATIVAEPHGKEQDRQEENPFIPDTTLAMPEAFEQYGIYYDQYRAFVIPLNLKEDKWVTGIKFVPGNPLIVRNCSISIDKGDKSKSRDDWDPGLGYFTFGELGFIPFESRWHNWNPISLQPNIPKDNALFLPKNANLIFHIHYGPTGIPRKDSSFVQIKWQEKEPANRLRTAPLIHPFNMKPDSFQVIKDKVTRFYASFTTPTDMELFGIYPHAHWLGKSWEIFATSPDSTQVERLLKIDEWNFHWKQYFEFRKPAFYKKGTTFHVLISYDNTNENLFNPSDPPANMFWGKKMYEEMFLVYFTYSIPQPNQRKEQIVFPIANLQTDTLDLEFQLPKKTIITCEIASFDGKVQHFPFANQSFTKGLHSFSYCLRNLPKGNFVITLYDRKKKILYQDFFLHCPPDFLD